MNRTLTIARAVFAALAVAAMAVTLPAAPLSGAPIPDVAPLSQPSTPAPVPAPSPMAAGLTLALPMLAGGFLAAALLRARRSACPPCPSCGSRRGAVVGAVGAYHRCCRCHDCGYLWEKEPALVPQTSEHRVPPASGGLR